MVKWQNSKNAQALKDTVQAEYPGTQVIYTVGDLEHQEGTSDHNPDDTAGLRTDQTDADSIPEVRGVDIMVNKTFTAAQAAALVLLLITVCKGRVYYVIYNRKIYHSKRGFKAEAYNGKDPHTNHVHVSTLAKEDNNANPWPIKTTTEDPNMALDGNDLKRSIATNTRVEKTTEMAETYEANWGNEPYPTVQNELVKTIKRIETKAGAAQAAAEAVRDRPAVEVTVDVADVAARIASALIGNAAFLAAVAKAVNDDAHARSAE